MKVAETYMDDLRTLKHYTYKCSSHPNLKLISFKFGIDNLLPTFSLIH